MNLEGAVPLTIPDAVEMLHQRLEAHDRAYILNDANTPASIHFFTGMRLRNAWKLWDPDTLVVQDANKRYGLGHADDISGMLLTALWVRVRSEALECTQIAAKVKQACDASAEASRKYWLSQGIDPLTLKPTDN